MPPPGLQIELPCRVTLTFDILTPKLIVLFPCSWTACANFQQYPFIRFQNAAFARLVTNGWTDERTDERPAGKQYTCAQSPDWWIHKNRLKSVHAIVSLQI